MKVIYVAGPYRADSHYGIQINIAAAAETAIRCWKKGWVAICSHLNVAHFYTYFDDRFGEAQIMGGDLELLSRCDAIVMIPGWEQSEGAKMEHDEAKKLGKQIFYGHDDVPWLNCGR